MKEIITKYDNDSVIELNDDNSQLFEMIEDFSVRSNTPDRTVLRLTFENGAKTIRANGYVGLLRFNDGTQLEIYPRLGDSFIYAKKVLGKLMSAYLNIPFEASLAAVLEKPESSFMEFFISVFVRECMKILKSGLLSGYTSVEENSSAMQGSIVFSENIRKNLTHRERLYVRHDVFTPDRAENRLIKTAATVMQKLTREHQNEQNLKKILVFLDEVKLSDNYDADFAKCVNTRNAKKYTAVLNICRMILQKKKSGLSGKYISNAILFPMEDLFSAYILKLAKENCREKLVRSQPKGAFLCEASRLFNVCPDIAIYEKDNSVSTVINAHWSRLRSENDLPLPKLYDLCVCAKKFNCKNAVMVLPSNVERGDIELPIELDGKIKLTVKFAALAPDTTADNFYDEPIYDEETDDFTLPEIEEAEPAENKESVDIPVKKETEVPSIPIVEEIQEAPEKPMVEEPQNAPDPIEEPQKAPEKSTVEEPKEVPEPQKEEPKEAPKPIEEPHKAPETKKEESSSEFQKLPKKIRIVKRRR